MVKLIPLTLSLKGGKLTSAEYTFISFGDAVNYLGDCSVVSGGSIQELVSYLKKNSLLVYFTKKKLYALLDYIRWWCTAPITTILIIWSIKWLVGIFTDLKT